MTIWPKNLFKAKMLTQNLIKSYKIDPKIYFSAKKSTLKMAHPVSQSMGVVRPPSLAKNMFLYQHAVQFISAQLSSAQLSSAQFDSVEVLAEMASHPITHFCRIRDAEMEMVPPPPPPTIIGRNWPQQNYISLEREFNNGEQDSF